MSLRCSCVKHKTNLFTIPVRKLTENYQTVYFGGSERNTGMTLVREELRGIH